jgi:GDP-L-fucose synthase
MNKDASIFLAGHRGLVGSALARALSAGGYRNVFTVARENLDLTDQQQVHNFFHRQRPDYVLLAAARVGGIQANDTYPGEFIYQNLMIQANVLHAAYQNRVQRLLYLGSSCIYPKHAPQPMREKSLLSGPLEPSNEPYAVAKIAGLKMCEAYNRQYGTEFWALMPTNLYGPRDNFHPENSHVLPGLMRRFHEAKRDGRKEVIIWGTGTPRREFLHVDDLATACLFLLNLPAHAPLFQPPAPPFVNVGTGQDLTIGELADLVRQVVGYRGEIRFDPARPDGTPRKLLDIEKISSLGWRPCIQLTDGIEMTYRWFIDHQSEVRS